MGGGNDRSWEVQAAFTRFSVNNSFSMKKRIQVPTSYPSYFSILHVSPNFQWDRINIKKDDNS